MYLLIKYSLVNIRDMYVCIRMYVCIHMYVCMYTYVRMYVYICTYVCIHMYVYICTYVRMCFEVPFVSCSLLLIRAEMCVYVCMYGA